jgi:hypothetical protein
MQQLACTCPPRDWAGEYWNTCPCPGCRERTGLEYQLHCELRLRPWETAVEDPDARNPYPAGCRAHEAFRQDAGAVARWRALQAAAKN